MVKELVVSSEIGRLKELMEYRVRLSSTMQKVLEECTGDRPHMVDPVTDLRCLNAVRSDFSGLTFSQGDLADLRALSWLISRLAKEEVSCIHAFTTEVSAHRHLLVITYGVEESIFYMAQDEHEESVGTKSPIGGGYSTLAKSTRSSAWAEFSLSVTFSEQELEEHPEMHEILETIWVAAESSVEAVSTRYIERLMRPKHLKVLGEE